MSKKNQNISSDFDLDLDSTSITTVPQNMATQASISSDLGDFSAF